MDNERESGRQHFAQYPRAAFRGNAHAAIA
jgi:hypothetical protein